MHVSALRYFVAVAEEGHFGRAATRLHIAQPSVSQAIRRLEAQVGHQLLDRSGRRVTVTAEGERVLTEVRAALVHLDRALSPGPAPPPRLRVGAMGLIANLYLPKHVRTLQQAHPGAIVRLVEMEVPEQTEALLDGRIDVAVGMPLPEHEDLETVVVEDGGCAVWMGEHHPLAALDTVALEALRGVPLLLGDHARYGTFAAWVRRAMASAGVPVTEAADVSDPSAAFAAMMAGSAVALACDFLPSRTIAGVACRPVTDPITWPWLATRVAGRSSPSVDAFLAAAVAPA